MNELSKEIPCPKCGNMQDEKYKYCQKCMHEMSELHETKTHREPKGKPFPGYLGGAVVVAMSVYKLTEPLFKESSEKIKGILGDYDYYDLIHLGFIIAAVLLYVGIVRWLNLLNKKHNSLINFAIKIIAGIISIFVMGMSFAATTGLIERSQTMAKLRTLTQVAKDNSNLLAEIKDKNEKSKIELVALINEQNKLYEHYEDKPMTFEALESNIRILTGGIVLLEKKKELFHDFYSEYLKLPAEYFALFGLTVNDVNKLLEKSDESTDAEIQLADLKISIYQNATKFKKGILKDSTVVDRQIDEEEKLMQHMDIIEKEYDALGKDFFTKLTGSFPDSIMSPALEDVKKEYKDLGIALDKEIDKLKTDQQ